PHDSVYGHRRLHEARGAGAERGGCAFTARRGQYSGLGKHGVKKVYLVGAGPGDPELITLKARRLLEQADCILYDHLANSELLEIAPATAERIYVGKKKSEHAATQDEICAMLVDRGRKGLNVVRLK